MKLLCRKAKVYNWFESQHITFLGMWFFRFQKLLACIVFTLRKIFIEKFCRKSKVYNWLKSQRITFLGMWFSLFQKVLACFGFTLLESLSKMDWAIVSEYWDEYNLRATTAVCKNGENSDKFTFIFRKKLYISKKISGYEVRHFCKPQNVGGNHWPTKRRKD